MRRVPATPGPVRTDPPWTRQELVLATIAAGAVAVLALWWASTPSVSGLGDILTSAGDICGLLAGYGVVVLVALMARLPPLERGVGSDRLARWHAAGGRYVVCLVVAHALLIIWGYAVTAHTSLIAESGTLMTSYADVLMATVAGFLLLGIGIISARAARRRMRYETWYYLHFYTYLAIALAFSHQFAQGPQFVSSLPARFAWSAMYAIVAALVVWYRIVTPLVKLVRHRFRVIGVRQEAADVISVYIGGRGLEELRAQPGQFFRWRFLDRDLWWQSHPYSLSALPNRDMLRITVRQRGDHSSALAALRPGTRVIAEGPFGALVPARTRRRVLLLAGGVGITPLRTMFAALPAGKVTLVYRASDPRDIVFRDELDAIAADRGGRVHYVTGTREQRGDDPLSSAHLQAMIPDLRRHEVYLCGPPGMTETAIDALRAAGVPRSRIHHESFEF
jgi:ferredoxin-NADP reductase/DMSO/TMAO reductase YedYZ heme-binding membrane subunit